MPAERKPLCASQDGVPRGAYRGTVQVSLFEGEVHLYIAPAPGFKWVKPEGEVLVDRTGAVQRVRRRLCCRGFSREPADPAANPHL
jgi:hypothetical protein